VALAQVEAVQRRGSRTPALLVTLLFGTVLLGANLAAPLYAVYRERFGFSTAVLTLVFATYALVLAPTLVLFGQLSDGYGRRVVLLVGLGIAAAGLLLFAVADGTGWLFAARAAQGLAVGTVNGAATAALVELEPERDVHRAALMSGLAQAAGSAAGAVLAGVLAQWAPDRLVLCYVVGLALTALAALSVLAIPESAPAAGRWRIQRPGVPEEIRGDFARVSLTAAAVWSVAALFFSVVPSYASRLLHSHDLALLAVVTATMLFTSSAVQPPALRWRLRHGQPIGLGLLTVGLLLLVLAFPLASLSALLVAAALAGAGHGIAFLGAQADLNRIAPDQRRGEVSAAFAVFIYLGVAVGVIVVGLLALAVSLFAAVGVFAAVIGGTALIAAAWHLVH
jgi:MFS family permease